jgi:hypothetical protein
MDPMEEKKSLNRREALKTIAASAGALGAAAFLPGKWSKPLVEFGVLPAHAQGTTVDLVISDLSINKPLISAPEAKYFAQFLYYDSMGQVDKNAMLYANATPCDETYYKGQSLTSISAKLVGTPYNGSIEFIFNPSLACVNGSQLNVQLGVKARLSNTLSKDLPIPEG